jgi:hypothetical protein
MSRTNFLAGAMLGLAAATVGGMAKEARGAEGDTTLKAELGEVARRRIYFGHQSVGWNLLDGLGKLASREGIPLRVVEVKGPLVVPPGTFAHGAVEENGDPVGKLESFARAMASAPERGVDVAFMKFCYVDFVADTDVPQLFARYQASIADLKSRHPSTTFVHVTAPLTTVQDGPKAFVKRLLGRAPGGVKENARREEYNALLRRAYLGREPIFDLAAVESTRMDGSRATVEWKGSAIPVLASEYTDDGGHLNEVGRLRGARAMVAVLAQVP